MFPNCDYVRNRHSHPYICCLQHKKTRQLMENLLGLPFLEKFAPKKGFSNLVIIVYPFFILWFLDTVSLHYIVSLKLQECRAQSLLAQECFKKGDTLQAGQITDSYLQTYEFLHCTQGIIRQASDHPYFVHIVDSLSKILGL